MESINQFYDKHYRMLLLIPIILFVLSITYMVHFHSQNHDFIYKDISLTGGTSVTLYDNALNSKTIEQDLSGKLTDVSTRSISDLVTREQKAVIIQTKTEGGETRQVLEEYLGYNLTSENSSFEFTGTNLSDSFYNQLLIAILVAFALMGIVVFLIFRTFVPSMTVILCAVADILMTIVTINLLGIKMSTAGIVAVLMLIGYSVDTDILLTTRLLKRGEGSLNQRAYESFKTGMTMTLTSVAAVAAALIVIRSLSPILSQMFTIILIGLLFDILNTWITNVSILKWYLEHKHHKEHKEVAAIPTPAITNGV